MLELDEGKLSRPVLRRGGESNLASLASDDGQHREHRLHQHMVLPLPPLTQFEVGRIALGGMEAGVTQDNHVSIDLVNQPLKGSIGNIGRGTVPPYHQAILVQQQTECAPNNPAVVGQALGA